MTNKEIVNNLPIGEVVPKRVLAAMKRKGLIYDYSPWGYLENCRVWYTEEYKGKEIHDYAMLHVFPDGNSPKEYDLESNLSSYSEVIDKFGSDWGKIEYLGHFFERKYLSGCFSPYLVKCAPPMKYDKATKKYYPEKRIYYKSFSSLFTHKRVEDEMSKKVWNLYHSKVKAYNKSIFDYVCEKSRKLNSEIRVRRNEVNRSMSLYGAIL